MGSLPEFPQRPSQQKKAKYNNSGGVENTEKAMVESGSKDQLAIYNYAPMEIEKRKKSSVLYKVNTKGP